MLGLAAAMVLPAPAAAQGTRLRVVVDAAAGLQLNVRGDNRSVAVGLALNDRVDLLARAERIHQPTERSQFAVTRGGTGTFVSGELRVVPVRFGRTSPYLLASVGRGESRLNVNERFPDPVTNDAWLVLLGAGARVPLSRRVGVFADVRVGVQGELDVIGLLVPLRVGMFLAF